MKKRLLLLLLLLTSCKSFLLTNKEEFNKMYVSDIKGCNYQDVQVITIKPSTFAIETLAFRAITNNDTILIPKLEFDLNLHCYTGIGTNKTKYTVTYLQTGKITKITR